MKIETVSNSIQTITRQRNLLAFSCLTLIVTLLLNTINNLTTNKSVVLIPSSVNSEMTISESTLSDSYIETVARDIITTYSNITPSNIEYSNEAILKFVSSNLYSSLKKDLEARKDDIIRKGISQNFFIREIVVDSETKKAIIAGDLKIFIGDKLTSTEEKIYSLAFNLKSLIIKLIEFREVTKHDLEAESQDENQKSEQSEL